MHLSPTSSPFVLLIAEGYHSTFGLKLSLNPTVLIDATQSGNNILVPTSRPT